MPPKAELYEELLFQLGDLARDRLAGRPGCPRSMQRVLLAEEALHARRQELEALEQELHTADEAWQDFLALNQEQQAEQHKVLKRFKGRLEPLVQRTKDLRRQQHSLRRELHAAPPQQQARLVAELEAVEQELEQLLTPAPEDPNAPGVAAHRRLLELEQQAAARRQAHERLLAEFDQAFAAKEDEVEAADAFLEQALFLLGEEVYTQRVADPQLAVFYPRLDQVAP